MTTNDDEQLTERLTDELHRRGDGLTDTPLRFEAVRGQAVSIRRRRRVASGLAVAAAVAVLVPTAVVAARNVNADGPQVANRTPSVSTPASTPSATPAPDDQPKPHALDVADLPTGAPPNLTYSTDQGYGDFTMVGDHTIRVFDTGVAVSSETSDKAFGPYPTSSPLARNAAGTIAAWVTDDGTVMAWQDGQTGPLTLGTTTLQGAQLEALTGTDCTIGACTAWISGNQANGAQASERIDGDGTHSPVSGGGSIVAVRDATDDGRVLGLTSATDSGSCSAVLAPPEESPLLASCDYTFDAFSPDGSMVLASEPYHDGAGSSVIATFATAGDRLAYRMRSGQRMAMYHQAVWEDDTHVLFAAYQAGSWSIVRMDAITGALETAVPPQPGDPYDCPFTLETT